MADIDIAAAIAVRLAAGKIQISFIGGEGGCGFPKFGIDAVAEVLGCAPAVGGQVGDIEIAAAVSIGEIATGKDQPLSVLGNVLGALVLVGVDIAGQAPGFAPDAIHFVGLIEIFVDIVDTAGVDKGVAVDGDGRIVFGDGRIDAVAHILRFELVAGAGVGGFIVEGKLIAFLPVFPCFPAGLVEVGNGQ